MNAARIARGRGDVVLLWLTSLVTMCAGYFIVFDLLGGAVDAAHQRTASVSEQMLDNAGLLAQRPALAREVAAVDEQLHELRYQGDTPTAVARFIHLTANIAIARGVRLAQIDAHTASGFAAPETTRIARTSGGAITIEAIPLDVTLRGSYRALVQTIRDLASAPMPMHIEIAAIERDATVATDTRSIGQLTARLHIVLERVSDEPPFPLGTPPLPEDPTTYARHR
jgi:Tfp pilus assembly protein PilO